MSRKNEKSRRGFIRETGSIAAAAAGGSVLSSVLSNCGGDGPIEPTTPSDTAGTLPLVTPTAAITGPAELSLGTIMDTVQAEFSSASSHGRITFREWSLEKLVDGFLCLIVGKVGGIAKVVL